MVFNLLAIDHLHAEICLGKESSSECSDPAHSVILRIPVFKNFAEFRALGQHPLKRNKATRAYPHRF